MKRPHSDPCRHVRFRIVRLMASVAIALVASPAAYAQGTLVVDDDGQGTAANCNASAPTFGSIQGAVDAALSGDAVFICPGVYDEQVEVTTSDLTIRGSGAGSTVLRPTVVD